MMLTNIMDSWFTLLDGAALLTFMEKLQLYSKGLISKFIHKGFISSFSSLPPPSTVDGWPREQLGAVVKRRQEKGRWTGL